VVNNNAGAVLLALSGLAQGCSVVVSRGQLVEIGGGFRIPDVLAQSGARLMEVGTTNRTHLRDYRAALESPSDAALVLRAHHSNYRIVGFHTEPTLRELVNVAKDAGLPVVDDLGSGALLDTVQYGLSHEPMVQESVQAGAGVVCFSGDKLIGGPQSGILVGDSRLVDPLKSHPLARALRADKMCLAALQSTLMHYLRDQAPDHVPVWKAISAKPDSLRLRAEAWRASLSDSGVRAGLVDGESTIGGGSLPGQTLPTTLLLVADEAPDQLAELLRAAAPPVIGRIVDNQLAFDPRTVLPHEDSDLVRGIVEAALAGAR
jgi:L-seryl-tRNA(Ser) seleniumtransferase